MVVGATCFFLRWLEYILLRFLKFIESAINDIKIQKKYMNVEKTFSKKSIYEMKILRTGSEF